MQRIELHSVTVIGCAQNKAKYCTQLRTATEPHVPKFLAAKRSSTSALVSPSVCLSVCLSVSKRNYASL